MKRFDIHTHILPGVDDGSKDMDMTRELLKKMVEEGVTDIIATPHYDTHHNRQDYDHIMSLVDDVRAEAKKISEDLTIYSGSEILYSHGVLEDIKSGKVPMLAETSFCLVEFYTSQEYSEIIHALNNIIMLGKTPVIAHLERYQCFYKDTLKRASEVIKMGAYIQVNSGSFNKGMFNKTSKFVKKLLLNNKIHFIGSDCHNPVYRKPEMESTFNYISKVAGEDVAIELTNENPQKLVQGIYL